MGLDAWLSLCRILADCNVRQSSSAMPIRTRRRSCAATSSRWEQRNDDADLSDVGAAAVDALYGSELCGLDGGLPAPLLLLWHVPSLDCGRGRRGAGSCRARRRQGNKERLVVEVVVDESPNVRAEVEPCSQDWWRHDQEELKSSLVLVV